MTDHTASLQPIKFDVCSCACLNIFFFAQSDRFFIQYFFLMLAHRLNCNGAIMKWDSLLHVIMLRMAINRYTFDISSACNKAKLNIIKIVHARCAHSSTIARNTVLIMFVHIRSATRKLQSVRNNHKGAHAYRFRSLKFGKHFQPFSSK